MRKRVLNALIVIVFTVMMFFVGYVEELKIPILSGSLLLDVPDDYVTELYVSRYLKWDEVVDKNNRSIQKSEIEADINDNLNYLPNGVLDMLEPYTIVVTNKDITTIKRLYSPIDLFINQNEIRAFIIYQSKKIFLNANNADYRATMYHEIGHLVDYSLDDLSASDEFAEICEKEHQQFFDKVRVEEWNEVHNGKRYSYKTVPQFKNHKEYFADVFDCYYTNRGDLWKYCPETYIYIQNILDGLEK